MKLIRLLAEQTKWGELEKIGRILLSQNPPRHEEIELIAYSLQQGGRLDAALSISIAATKLFPKSWIFHFLAGTALKGKSQQEEACIYLTQALTLDPNDRQTIRLLIQSIAVTDGVNVAAEKYIAHCNLIGIKENIIVAPISTVRNWSLKTGNPLLEAGEVEEIPYKAPHVWGGQQASNIFFASSNKPYVIEINDARIFSNSSLILTTDGTVLSDTGGDPNFGHIVSFAYEQIVLAQQHDKLLLEFSEFNTKVIEAGLFLSGLASSAFGHWLPEFLPKLQFLQQHPDFANLPIIVDAGMPQSHFDHLRRLVSNQLILLQANESFLCRRLLVAPAPAFLPIETFPNDISMHKLPGLSPRAMRFIQAGNSFSMKKINHRRIFLARKNMKWRRLLNEEEVVADLKKLGFEIIFIEEMNVDEQINLFREASLIVAPNGSALLNLIFADVSTKLLVLISPDLNNWGTFQGPMDALGYQSICVCGDYALIEGYKHSDYHVPLRRIREALSYLGISEALRY